MSTNSRRWAIVTIGDITSESTERLGGETAKYPVYGVDRSVGLTTAPKYVAGDLARYKHLRPGMFAYNPMRLNIGSIGFCTNKHETGLVSPDYVVFRCNITRLHPEFLHYYIQSSNWREWTRGAGVGSVRMRIYFREISRMPLLLPSLSEQRAIAHILGALDDKIELNRQMNETLEAIAQAFFKSWFVDFDPVRAKAEGRDPGLPKKITALFPNSFENTDLGEIPKGWPVQPFADTVTIIGGGTPKTSVPSYWDGDVPWFSVVDAPRSSDVWVVDTEKKITHEGVVNSSTRMLPVGTTIISARGTVGKIGLVSMPMTMNQSCYGLRSKVETQGFYTYFATRQLVANLKQHAHGSVFDTITRDTLAGVSIASPPAVLIEAFEARVGPVLERIRVASMNSHTLAVLRNTLLPKLLACEIRVKT